MKLISIFKKQKPLKNPTETKFEQMMNLVKDLDEADYKRMVKAMNASYTAYSIFRNIESKSIDALEHELEEI